MYWTYTKRFNLPIVRKAKYGRKELGAVLQQLKKGMLAVWKDFGTFVKWVLFSCLIGVVVGGVGILFHYAIEFVTGLRKTYDWLILFLPVGGLLILLAYHFCRMEKDRGTNFVLIAVRTNEPMPLRTAPLIFFSTLVTHLCGGSSGREGAALQLGGSISSRIGRWMRLDDKDERIITMCGMSAAFSALFGTPLTAAVFSMEVVSVGVMYYAAIVPCVLSSVIGAMAASMCGIAPTQFTVTGIPPLTPLTLLQVAGLSVLCALLSILFCIMMHKAPALYRRVIPNRYLCIAVAGVLVAFLSFLVGTQDYNGAGMDVIARAIAGEARWEAFALKLVFTALTLGAGFKGGEIVPVFFIGATFGNVMGGLLGLPPSFGAALGMVSVFCGVTNCPLTSLILSFELFGTQGIALYAVACAVSYMMSGYYVYSEQKILYSKVKPEFIDKRAQ